MKQNKSRTLVGVPGKKIGRLTTISFSHNKNSIQYWLFNCDCGKQSITRLSSVINGNVRSCGCLKPSAFGVY